MKDENEIGELTEILSKWGDNREESVDVVFPKVYEKLKQLARKARRSFAGANLGDTLSPTELVSSLYIKLNERRELNFGNRAQFYGLCLVSMQRMLHDYYLRKSSKRNEVSASGGPDDVKDPIEELINLSEVRDGQRKTDALELSIAFGQALELLRKRHPVKADIVVLKYWLDMTDNEIVEQVGLSKNTVRRELTKGLILIREMIDKDLKALVDQASAIEDTTVRNGFLREHAGDDRRLLDELLVLLNERKKASKA